MTKNARKKDQRRDRLFEMIREKSRADSAAARIRRIARLKATVDDLEPIKFDALRSLRANR